MKKLDYYQSFSPKLEMWFVEAHEEANSWDEGKSICIRYALYPRRFYKTIAGFDHTKKTDYCFIGGFKTDQRTENNRKWILGFIEKYFTEMSYLQFTDKITKSNYVIKGCFDYTLKNDGFVPKEHPVKERNKFDEKYFKQMAKSKFTLCPAGDSFWSMRFYEALMCRSIPIVNSVNETFRSKEESGLDYRYYLTTDNILFREDWVEHNYRIFLKNHTLEII
ncbi:MAG: glycosyltransferase family 47 protein [Proteobacteria bacterium]|nr:glycosyltransferase family 47 protein [Pseudomonadota bacterium]MBU1059992.1 glycosyltransferase family 47 protein [Pseudomonadota bacterium]